MIHVQRDQTDEAGKIFEPNSAWFQLAAAKTKRAIKERGKQKADGKVYAHDEVRKALERLFHDKCAYCELTKVEGWEVDHFRPKGRVAEREDHPGYYWLTYVWENLYPSCQHCNQRRKDRPRWADQAGLPAGGKADQFPLLDESSRAMRPKDDIHAESRLLLDPCFDDPEEYLAYDPTGQVFSLNDPDGSNASDVASKTIEIFHLQRRRLKGARRDTIKAVTRVIRMIANHIGGINLLAELQGWIDDMQGDRSQYAGLARYVVSHSSEFGV